MRRPEFTFRAAIAAASLLAAAGCATSSSPAPQAGPETARPAESAGAVEMESASGGVTLQPVYFATDRWTLREDAQLALRANADAIRAHTEWGLVTIEGHCDERGSDEYNLALGERRANAVRRYLVDLGVPSSRLRTVSFGEENPAVSGHDESAWRYNRRSELKNEMQQASR
jgi:peptidoglycan-associated lipoprotein